MPDRQCNHPIVSRLESGKEIAHRFNRYDCPPCRTLARYHSRSGLSGGAISVLAASRHVKNLDEFVLKVAKGEISVTPTANDISHLENGRKPPSAAARAGLAHAFSLIEGREITEADLFPEYVPQLR